MSSTYPKDWQLHELSDVCYFQEGPGLRNWQYRDSGIKFINIRCIKEGSIDTSIAQCLAADEVHAKYRHFLLDEDDIVLSSSGTIGRAAVVKKEDLPLLLNTSVIRFRPINYSLLHREYLFYFLQSEQFLGEILEQSQGSAQVNFGPTHLKQLQILLPPLPEQKEIAEILSGIDEAINALTKKQQKIELVLRQATIESTTPWNGSMWREHTIGEIVTFQGGAQPPRSTFKFAPEEGYIRMLQIRDYKSDTRATYIPLSMCKRFCSKEDVMIGRYGPPNFQILRGKEGSYNVALIKASPKDNAQVTKDYVYRFLQRGDLFMLMDALSQRTSGQQGLDMDALKEFPIFLPDIPTQKHICTSISQIETICLDLKHRANSLRHLKSALSEQLLSGRKRVSV